MIHKLLSVNRTVACLSLTFLPVNKNDNARNLWTKNVGKSTNVLFKPWLILTTALCMTTAYGHINRHIYMYISQKKNISKTDILIKDTLQITYSH